MIHRIVLTGAPASGKSTGLKKLGANPALKDFVFLEELARQLLSARPDFRNNWAEFHREIYTRQLAREDELIGRSFITDRGTADAFAFHPETMKEYRTTLESEYNRYTAVIQLGSTAGLGIDYFRQDEIRNETIDEVRTMETATSRVWCGHRNYHFVPAKEDFVHKLRCAVDTVLSLINSK